MTGDKSDAWRYYLTNSDTGSAGTVCIGTPSRLDQSVDDAHKALTSNAHDQVDRNPSHHPIVIDQEEALNGITTLKILRQQIWQSCRFRLVSILSLWVISSVLAGGFSSNKKEHLPLERSLPCSIHAKNQSLWSDSDLSFVFNGMLREDDLDTSRETSQGPLLLFTIFVIFVTILLHALGSLCDWIEKQMIQDEERMSTPTSARAVMIVAASDHLGAGRSCWCGELGHQRVWQMARGAALP